MLHAAMYAIFSTFLVLSLGCVLGLSVVALLFRQEGK